jgi:hypothetical protein
MIYKFILDKWTQVEAPVALPPGVKGSHEVNGMGAVVRASSHDEAMQTLMAYCKEEGLPTAWVGVARVIEFKDPDLPKVLFFAAV